MSVVKANNNKDTYKATAIALILIGILYIADKFIHFSNIGLPWVMQKDSLLLYTAICFLIFKRDKSVGFILVALWLVMNINLVISWLGTLSGYLLPLALLLIGGILLLISRR